MKINKIFFVPVTSLILIYCLFSYASEKKEFVIIDKIASARILSQPLNGNVLGRIPAGKKVQIFNKKQARSGMLTQTWYFVKYNNIEGWISQYVTMGDIIKEYEETGQTEISRAPNADKPKLITFDEQAKKDFREWALKNTAVTWFEYQEDGIIWVKLIKQKYTTKGNGKKIAKALAHYYRLQTNYQEPVVVTIWTYENKVWAKGHQP